MEGFIILDHLDFDEEFYAKIPPLIASKKLKLLEDVTEGLENAEKAFVGLFSGSLFGKPVIKLADS